MRSAGVYRKEDLKVASRGKAGKDWTVDDLPDGANKTEALSKDIVAIVEGNKVTVLAPTGSLSEALAAVRKERSIKGI